MDLAALRAAFEAARNLDNLRALRAGLETELRSLNTAAGDADFTAEQQTSWDALEAEHTGLATAEEELTRAERVRESRAKWGSTQVAPAKPGEVRDVRAMNRKELRSAAMRHLDDAEATEHLADIQVPSGPRDADGEQPTVGFDVARAKAHIASLIRKQTRNFNGEAFTRWMLATEAPAYRSAFPKLVSGGTQFLEPEEIRAVQLVQELRATMNITTDNQGGFGIPVLIDPTIILTGQGSPNDFWNIARVENITNDEWKGITSAGATSYWTSESTTMTDGGPTLAQPTVTSKKLTTLIKYSFEFQGDYPNWASEMATLMAASHQEKLVEAFTQGLGNTAQPQGVITGLEANAATSKVMVATDGALFPADFYAITAALPVKYRANARWMYAQGADNIIRGFSQGSSAGDANFTVNLTSERIPGLFGKPVHLNDYMDAPVGYGGSTSASDITPVIYGDWRSFLIANRVGATIETVQHLIDTSTGLPNGNRGTFMWARVGSGVVNPAGLRYLHQSA